MRDPTIRLTRPDRASDAAWAARIVGVTFIFLLLLFVLFWPILAERHSDRLMVKLGVACSDMVAHIGQAHASGGDFTQHWPTVHPECWPAWRAQP
jgi:hypothetical protein